jgi:prepilin-type N-terminal cleavage/methylation domain-containing protein
MLFLRLKNNKGPARTGFRGGFTLVEMMVAIAVFSIVMVVAMSALLNVIDANNKARSIKTAINNISFALEGISKDMRMGEDYECFETLPDDPNQCAGIKYRSPRAGVITTGDNKGKNMFAYYKYEVTQLYECLEKISTDDCSIANAVFSPITSYEVTLKKVRFYILGVGEDGKQPRMIMTISGTAGPENKPKLQTDFDLQTSVSQRKRI